MLAQCLIFFLAGYDTTATTITMTCYNLATHPEMQDQLYTEIKQVIAKLSSEMNTEDPFDLVTLDTLSRFEYLNAVVNETLRIHPPVPSIERRAAADIKLETSDGRICIDLKKGDVIHIPIWSIHHDPDNYEEPNSFRPDRFIGEPKHHRYAHIPFGSGPRTCVARSLGLLEAKMAVLHLVRHFRMSVCDQTAVSVEIQLIPNPKLLSFFPNRCHQLSTVQIICFHQKELCSSASLVSHAIIIISIHLFLDFFSYITFYRD